MSIELVMPSNYLILCHPLLPSSIFPSIRFFSNESVLCIRWLKYWNVNFSISPSNEYSELISFRMDWFDLLAVQRTLKSLLQHHSSKASILWCSAFIIVQLSHPYMTTRKTALNRQTFVGKVMSLLLSMLVIAFLSRSKSPCCHHASHHGCSHHLEWFWSSPKIVSHCFHCFPIYLTWSDGTRCHDLRFLDVELWDNFFTSFFHFHQKAL